MPRRSKKKHPSWWLYMVRCKDGSIYTGITNDLLKRIETHNAGKGALYTKFKRPVVLVYQERQKDVSTALKREYRIKKLQKSQKERLAAGLPILKPKRKKARVSKRKRRA